MIEPLLSIQNLGLSFFINSKIKNIVEGLSLDIYEKEIVALVGGSGSGKTLTGLSILKLLPQQAKAAGKIIWQGVDLMELSEKRMGLIRGKEISMVFQEPLSSLNPVFTIGYQIDEVVKLHAKKRGRDVKEYSIELLNKVGIPDPKKTIDDYPHQLSGGMRQRAMIAMSIAANPRLLIADEPTSNLDVTIQAQILELFSKLKDDLNISIILITHDLSIVKHLSDRVAVMHKGKIVECGKTDGLLENPHHYYTRDLLEAVKI